MEASRFGQSVGIGLFRDLGIGGIAWWLRNLCFIVLPRLGEVIVGARDVDDGLGIAGNPRSGICRRLGYSLPALIYPIASSPVSFRVFVKLYTESDGMLRKTVTT